HCTVTDNKFTLIHIHKAVAVTFIISTPLSAKTVFVQAPAVTVVVPCDTPPFNTSIIVPLASVLVPLTDVAPAQMGEVTTGVADVLTVTDEDNALTHLPDACAVAVITSPFARAVIPVNVHAPEVT